MQYYNQPVNGLVNWPNVTTGPYTPQSVTPVQQPQNTFVWVQGEEAARNYPVAAGNTIVLIDSDKPIMYMKTSDLSGKPQPMQIRYLVTKEDFDKIQNGSSFSPNADNYVTKEAFEKYVAEAESKFVTRRKDK